MKIENQRYFLTLIVLAFVLLTLTSCDDDFYLSEHEAKSYGSIFLSESVLNQHFDNLAGREIALTFNNSSGTPRLQSTNLLTEMRRTELTYLEGGYDSVSLSRLSSELETQISKWVEGRLRLYTNSSNNEQVELTRLNTIRVRFLNNPTFDFQPDNQAIGFNMNLQLIIDGEIYVNAVNWLVNIFTNINGTYPLRITLPNLRLNGQAEIYSPYANAGRIRFQMIPNILSQIQVTETGGSIPNAVKNGVKEFLSSSLSKRVDEIFLQEYNHFALPQIGLDSEIANSSSSIKASYRSKTHWNGTDFAPAQIHTVSRASDGKLYHSQKSNGDWSTYSKINFPVNNPSSSSPITSEPSLFHSGGNQLELTATNQNGELVYSHFRDQKWGNTSFISSNYARFEGKPAVAASAKGQAETIVQGDDGNLWHIRRVNGNFQTPSVIPINGFPNFSQGFHKPNAVFVGNKIVVNFSDGQEHIGVIAFDLETSIWGQPSVFKNEYNQVFSIEHSPTIVASGESRVDVAYAKNGGNIYHQILDVKKGNFQNGVGNTGISFVGKEKQIQGKTNASPVLAVSAFHQPELFVRGLDNFLYHNIYFNSSSPKTIESQTIYPGWQSWKIIKQNIHADTPQTKGLIANFSAAGTRNGKTEVIARAIPKYPFSTSLVFHNEFISKRFGRSSNPWKTVHWRGWEATKDKSFVGQPAIAAIDRSFQMANIGDGAGFGATLNIPVVGETNSSNFLSLTSTVDKKTPVINPMVLASGVGTFDTFVFLKTGYLQHTRHYANGISGPQNLVIPNGEKLTGISATTYGNGFVELAGRTAQKNIYHWTFRSGGWNQATKLAEQIISKPIIKYTGAGQIELLAISSSNQLIRRKFVDNSWTQTERVPHDFPINHRTFASGSASSWGDGSVDLAIVNHNTKSLYHRRIGPENSNCNTSNCPQPRGFSKIGGSVIDTPVLTAFSPTSLNILTMQGLRWHSTWSNAKLFQPYGIRNPLIEWSNHEYIGGDEMILGETAHTGRNNFVTIAIRNGEFYINRSAGKNWNGFRPLLGQKPDQILRQPIFLPAITSYGN